MWTSGIDVCAKVRVWRFDGDAGPVWGEDRFHSRLVPFGGDFGG